MKSLLARLALTLALATVGFSSASAQYLFWKHAKSVEKFTAIYGQIDVVADAPGTYFAGCNWRPGGSAPGYAGLEFTDKSVREVHFQVWDTNKDKNLLPEILASDPRTKRSKAEHSVSCNLPYNFELGHTFQFYLTKRPDESGNNTYVSLYLFDEGLGRWMLESRMLCTGRGEVADFADLCSFLDNTMSKKDKSNGLANLELIQLWAGTNSNDLRSMTTCTGKEFWGTLNGNFFLAQGDEAVIRQTMERFAPGVAPVFGKGKESLSVPEHQIPPNVLEALNRLP